MKNLFRLSEKILTSCVLGLLFAIPAEGEFPKITENQKIIEWNAQSDAVGSSHVVESRLAFTRFAKNYLNATEASIVKMPETANLADFERTLVKVINSSGADVSEVLRIFVNSHGSTDSFQSHDVNTEIFWEDFVFSLSKTLKAAKQRPRVVELYLTPCFSGSIIPALKKHFRKKDLAGVEVNVWTGSSGFTTTSSPEFPEAMDAFANLKFTLDRYLKPAPVCSEGSAIKPNEEPIDLIRSLGGVSFSDFWTNAGGNYRRLSAEELQQLLGSENHFLEQRALQGLLQIGRGGAESSKFAAAILKNSARDYYTRTLAAEYLGILPKNEIAIAALLEVSKDPKTRDSANSIRSAAIEAIGYADPGSAPLLIKMFNSSEYAYFRKPILEAIGATKDPTGVEIIRAHLNRKILCFKTPPGLLISGVSRRMPSPTLRQS